MKGYEEMDDGKQDDIFEYNMDYEYITEDSDDELPDDFDPDKDYIKINDQIYELMETGTNTTNSLIMEFLQRTKNVPLLTREEEHSLATIIQTGTQEERKRAINILVERNLRLVVSLVHKYHKYYNSLEIDELVQEGVIGLHRAAEKFDPSTQNKFSTYATFWIKQAIMRNAPDLQKTIRIPAHMLDKQSRVKRTIIELEKKGYESKDITPQLIRKEMKKLGEPLTLHEIKSALNATKDAVSIEGVNSGVDGDEQGTLLDFVDFGQLTSAEDHLDQQEIQDTLSEALSYLSPREKMILIMKEGLFGETAVATKDIAAIYGITIQRVRQVHQDAMAKLVKNAKHFNNGLFEVDQ